MYLLDALGAAVRVWVVANVLIMCGSRTILGD